MKRERKSLRRLWMLMICVCFLAPAVRAEECSHEYALVEAEATCTGSGLSYLECSLCGDTQDYHSTPALGHEFDEWYVVQEPTCTKEGLQARDCVRCGYREEEAVPHLGHSYTVEVVAPTCTARGYTSHYCPGCGDRFRTDYTDPTGHHYDGGVVTREPTLTAMGRITYTCLGCGDTYQETIPKLTNPFEDVSEGAYYFEPVLWAVYRGITSGVDDTHFAPEAACSRAQVVTFLWRAAGCPEPEAGEDPFTDVPEDVFYHDAVLWAYQKGITTGTDAVHFSPLETCIRAQVVTFLHRARGCPETEAQVRFPDVKESDYFYDAVRWAAGRKITVGMDSGYFRPELTCTRAQIVTFLYRDAKNE